MSTARPVNGSDASSSTSTPLVMSSTSYPGTSLSPSEAPSGDKLSPLLPHALLVVLLLLILLADFLLFRRRSRLQLERAQEKQVLEERYPKHVMAGLYRIASCPPSAPSPPSVKFVPEAQTPGRENGQRGSKLILSVLPPLPPPQDTLLPVAESQGHAIGVTHTNSIVTHAPSNFSNSASSEQGETEHEEVAETKRSSFLETSGKRHGEEPRATADLLPESRKDNLLNVHRNHRRKKHRKLLDDLRLQDSEANSAAAPKGSA